MSKTLFAKRAVAHADVLVQEVEGEAILLNLKHGQYYSLDKIGSRMWKTLLSSGSIQGAFDQLIAQFEVDSSQLEHDLQHFIEKLVQHELVELCQP